MTMIRTYLDPRALEMRRPFVTSRGTWTQREVCVVCVEAGEHRGFGEAAPLPGFSLESFEQSVQDSRVMCQVLEGSSPPRTIPQLESLMQRIGEGMVPSACFAVEGALLDVMARIQGVSVAQLLSPGWSPRVEVNGTLSSKPAPESFTQAMYLKDEGHTCFKIKVGVKPLDEELASVRAVREAVGDAATLRLDANGAWTSGAAIATLMKMNRYNLSLIEQPVPAYDIEGMARVREAMASHGVLVAADESLTGPDALDALIAHDAADVIVLKPMMLGGVLPTRRLILHAYAHGITSIITTLLEGVVGRTLTAHLAAASVEHLHGPCGLDTGTLLQDDLASEPYTISDGVLTLSDVVGLGLDVVLSAGAHGVTAAHVREPSTLPMLCRRAHTHAQADAVCVEQGISLSYEALHERAARLVTWCIAGGVKRGDRVALCGHNGADMVAMMHALMALGVCIVPLHPGWTDDEIASAISRTMPALVLGDVSRHAQMTTLDEAAQASTLLDPATNAQMSGYRMEDRAVILFTSGTTGTPKMASLTWANLFYSAMGSAIRLGHLPGERWGLSLPLCHIGGLSIVVRCALLGTTAVVFERFDAGAVADALVAGEMTMWSGVSAMMWQVLEAMGDRRPHASFRFALLGGGPVPESLLDACARHDLPVATTYGMTETGSQLTTRSPEMAWADAMSAGPSLLFSQARVAQGAESGELEVRGETLCEGYLDESLGVMDLRDEQGWFATGDWGRVDERGSVHILERRTDMIVTGGENVYPAEIEAVLAEHDGVQDVCVVGLPDERWGQRVVAVLVSQGRNNVDMASVLAMSQERLASFKVPRQMECWGELPRTSLGKLRRAEVREQLLQCSAKS